MPEESPELSPSKHGFCNGPHIYTVSIAWDLLDQWTAVVLVERSSGDPIVYEHVVQRTYTIPLLGHPPSDEMLINVVALNRFVESTVKYEGTLPSTLPSDWRQSSIHH